MRFSKCMRGSISAQVIDLKNIANYPYNTWARCKINSQFARLEAKQVKKGQKRPEFTTFVVIHKTTLIRAHPH
jgi:hypothetical protein